MINDRSGDATAELLDAQRRRDPRFTIITITDRKPGFAPKKRAIDKAVRQSDADVIILTDADGRPGPYWLRTMADRFESGADMVLGYAPYSPQKQHKLLYGLVTLEYFSVAAVAAATTAMRFPVTCVGTNMAYRRALFLEVDGFGPYKHIISGDDDLFLTHVREQKRYHIDYVTDARAHVFNAPPRSIGQYIHQRLRYASKGFRYPIKVTLALTIYVLYNAAWLYAALQACLGLADYALLTLAFFMKTGAEFLFLHKAAKLMSEQRTLKFIPLAALLHPFYILFFGVLGQLNIFRWKETKMETGVSR